MPKHVLKYDKRKKQCSFTKKRTPKDKPLTRADRAKRREAAKKVALASPKAAQGGEVDLAHAWVPMEYVDAPEPTPLTLDEGDFLVCDEIATRLEVEWKALAILQTDAPPVTCT